MSGLFSETRGAWLPSYRSDPRAVSLYSRHYSAKKNYRPNRQLRNCVGPGAPMVLLTEDCRAVFIWLSNKVERWDHQDGICCTLFRNEGDQRSSDLIREASALAWERWPLRRLWTYVDPREVASANPGYCFKQADWLLVRDERGVPITSTRGLLILEILPAAANPLWQLTPTAAPAGVAGPLTV